MARCQLCIIIIIIIQKHINNLVKTLKFKH